MNKFYILTLDGVFSQHLKPWSTLDVNRLQELFVEKGFDVSVLEYKAIKSLERIKGCFFLTSSSQNPNRKSYIEDHCFDIYKRGGVVIPNIELLKAHENKGYQVLMSRRLGLVKPDEEYLLSDDAQFKKLNPDEKFVVKTTDGAGSHGVALVKEKRNLDFFILKNRLKNFGFFVLARWLKYVLKYRFTRNTSLVEIKNYYKPVVPTCRQEFLPDLQYDYKVIFFGHKAFYLKRLIRKNDFRASGSNFFEFIEEPNTPLLNFAFEQYNKFEAPFISLDIVETSGRYYIIEFQSPHLGPYTILNANVYYQKKQGKDEWNIIKNEFSCLEQLYVDSITKFIKG